MARFHILSSILLLAQFLQCSLSIYPPEASPRLSPAGSSPPSPPPQSDLAPASLSTPTPAPSLVDLKTPAPVPAPQFVTLPPSLAPEIANTPSLAPNDALQAPVPAPAEGEIPYEDADDSKPNSSSSSGGRKAGIAIGVIVGACVVGVGGKLYKKRRDNIRRSRYRYSSREDFL